MRLTYRYRLSITKAERTSLERTLESCRWLYNKTLEIRKNTWEQEQKSVGRYDTVNMIPQWKAENPTLSNVHSQVLQEVCTRVDLAYQAFFRRVKAGEEKVGYPRFKGYGRYDSFTYPQSGFRLDDDRLTLSKIGTIRVKLHRPSPPTKLRMLAGVLHWSTPEVQRKCVPVAIQLFPKTCLFVSMIALTAA